MYKDLKALFGTEVPSVRKFKQKLKDLPPEEQHAWRISAYHAAFCNWSDLPVSYRKLLSNLIQNDWQGALDFLVNDTVLSTLRYPLQDPDLLFICALCSVPAVRIPTNCIRSSLFERK